MIKKILKQFIGQRGILLYRKVKYSILNFICSFFPMNDEILLESHPDLSCNTFELYRYMLMIGVNQRTRIVWLVNNPVLYSNVHEYNVEFICIYPKTITEKFSFYKRCNRAKILITCNRHIAKYKTSSKQLNIYIEHGSPIKYARPDIDGLSCGYFISQADFFTPYLVEELSIRPEQVVSTGFPRNDQLFVKHDSIRKLYNDIFEYNKVIIWVPTFRQKILTGRKDSTFTMPLGIPIIYDISQLKEFNRFLESKKTLLIIKPHPAQDLNLIKNIDLSNIRLLWNETMLAQGIQTNELLEQTDAMITDYSGIYFDYLLLNRPIAITLDDIKEYAQQTGFVFDNPLDVLKGEYVYSFEELCDFIEMVYEGKDNSIIERQKIRDLTNAFSDDKASERVYDFVMKKVEEYASKK